jgi:nucleotide-binding universal stress UspA family protein
MYRSIYVPLDNSRHSLAALELAIDLARRSGALLTGSHVYAAKLHDRRFRQMEGGLPAPYRKEDKLVEQRGIHDDLIARGLKVISDSYLDVFSARCAAAGLEYRRVALEGRNFERLAADVTAGDFDLVAMGSHGLGAVESTQLGSVCERVARRIDRDLLVVREPAPRTDGAIAVALDGSARAWGGFDTALELAAQLGRPLEAVAAFDPFFHYVAFESIAGVLSREAAGVFRFKEQERLHEEIIDAGLAKIYQGHLDVAATLARERGIGIETRLLAGKAFEQLLRYARETSPWLLVLGRTGVHSGAGMDLGGATENLLRLAPCNLLLSARESQPPVEQVAEATMTWTEEAEARIGRVPEFARAMARKAVTEKAIALGHTVVTSDVIDALMARLPGRGGRCPFAAAGEAGADEPQLDWDEAAAARLDGMPEAMRAHAKLRIEKLARRMKADRVTAEVIDRAG